jgi:hypothetical protein
LLLGIAFIKGRFSDFNYLEFTPLESPGIYAGDGKNRKHQLLIEGGVKALPFQTGYT